MPQQATRFDEDVRAVVEAVTGRGPLRPHDALELDSLGAVELVLAVEEHLGVRLADGPPGTVAEAVEAYRAAGGAAPSSALQPGIGRLQWLVARWSDPS